MHGKRSSDKIDPTAPIRVSLKPPKGKKRKNIFIDDRGFPDQSDEFDTLLHSLEGGPIIMLCKRRHPAPAFDDIDPAFNHVYNESLHGAEFKEEFTPSPLLSDAENKELEELLKRFWCVFDHRGLFVPVKDYVCDVNTGTARPIAVKGNNYGPYETPIMRKCIAKLKQLGHISQINKGPWLFKALLAPKPHQEHIKDIADFIWGFCVNYIPLNAVTCVIAYPIPSCDSYVALAFGDGKWFWLIDAPQQGYHQLRVALKSQIKLAFKGPDATKWTYNVMPFGPVNGPAIFVEFMHDVDSTWKSLAQSRGIVLDDSTNTRIIIDDVLTHCVSFAQALKFIECQLILARSQNLSLNLRKCHWFPSRLEFVGTDVTPDGNRPAQSKHALLRAWPTPAIVKDVASFVGFAVFYSKYIAWFESHITRLREIMKHNSSIPLNDLCGTPLPNQSLMIFAMPSFLTQFCAASTIAAVCISCQTSAKMVLDTLLLNQVMMKPPSLPLVVKVKAATVNFCSQILSSPSTLSRLDADVRVATRNASIPTLVKVLPVTGLSTKFAISSLAANLLGSLTAMRCDSSFPMMVTTLPSFAFKCD
jgi:hypothetical protein